MKLSTQAIAFINSLSRDEGWVVYDRAKVVNYFHQHNMPVFDKVIEFQMEYSGLFLTVYNDPGSSFKARLFSCHDIVSNAPLDFLLIEGQYFFYCGDYETAQFWFVLSQEGEVGIYDNSSETVNPIFSSFEKFIEAYAFEDLLQKNGKHVHPPFYKVKDCSAFSDFAKKYFSYDFACDAYNEWLLTDECIIHKGKWFDRSSFYIHIYGDDSIKCEDLAGILKNNKIID